MTISAERDRISRQLWRDGGRADRLCDMRRCIADDRTGGIARPYLQVELCAALGEGAMGGADRLRLIHLQSLFRCYAAALLGGPISSCTLATSTLALKGLS